MFGILKRGLRQGLSMVWTLGKIIFPVTLFVTILQYTPILPWIINRLAPIMSFLGLPGEAAIPLVLGNALHLYAAIGATLSLDFTVKEVFIIAMMLSFSHNLFIESAVVSRVGISWWFVAGIRIMLAIIAAITINLFWQGGSEAAQYGFLTQGNDSLEGWNAIILHSMKTAFVAVIQLALIVTPLMIVTQLLREKGWITILSNGLAPFTKLLGMKKNTSTTLVAGLAFGLAYGAGLMIQAVKEDGVSRKDMMLALIFLLSCHAVVEDTVVFIPLGIPVWPLLVARLVTAIILTMTVAFIWNRVELRKKGEDTA